MFVRCACLLSAIHLTISTASAQTAEQAAAAPAATTVQTTEDTGQALIAERLRFIQETYQPVADQVDELRKTLTNLLPDQQYYQARIALTLHRLRIARAMVEASADLSKEGRAKTMARFEGQYHRHLARAPLSYANVISQVEAMLPSAKVDQGRARIKARFGDRLGGEPADLDLKQIDALLSGPIPYTEPPQMPFARFTPAAQPAQPDPAARQLPVNPPAAQPAATRASPRPKAASPPAPPKPLPPAPPQSQWADYLRGTSAKFAFSARQEQAAEAVVAGCQARAAAHRREHGGDYAQAEKITDPAERAARLRTLNQRLDRLYSELTQRVDSIVTVEQRQKVEGITPPKSTPQGKPRPAKTEPPKKAPQAKPTVP